MIIRTVKGKDFIKNIKKDAAATAVMLGLIAGGGIIPISANMITGAAQMDGAILVVAAGNSRNLKGEHILLAR